MLPVFDGHNDVLTRRDHALISSGRPHGHLDLPHMRQGGCWRSSEPDTSTSPAGSS